MLWGFYTIGMEPRGPWASPYAWQNELRVAAMLHSRIRLMAANQGQASISPCPDRERTFHHRREWIVYPTASGAACDRA
jgi:hypothetical protein